MNRSIAKSSWMTIMMLAGLAAWSFAQEVPAARHAAGSPRGAMGFVSTLDKRVGLTGEQRDAVRGLLAEQRQKSLALRQEIDGKIRGLLNVEQQKKFDVLKAEQKARAARKN